MPSRTAQKFLLLLGDAAVFYIALVSTLWMRYLEFPTPRTWYVHNIPFLLVHMLWIVIFYIAGLYDATSFVSGAFLRQKILRTMAIAGLLAILLFYFMPTFIITPKTNLMIDVTIVTLLLWGWRRFFASIAARRAKINVLFFGLNPEIAAFAEFLSAHPHIGYRPALIVALQKEHLDIATTIPVVPFAEDLDALVKEHHIHLIVTASGLPDNREHIRMLYRMLTLGVTVLESARFYEDITGKIPVSLINERWFLEHVSALEKGGFETFKRVADIVLAVIFGIPALFLFPFVAGAILLSQPTDCLRVRERRARAGDGILFFRQNRVGKNGELFRLVKFRSQVLGAERMGEAKELVHDPRQYPVGRFLRKTYLDELPQIWNVLKGEMSFVGPRPERPEFVRQLKEAVPFYEMRLLVRPGITGWAQIRMKDDASVEDALEKLQHDLFYIKRRNVTLEIAIILRTLAVLLRRSGR
jgi:lipopolysaccharide/colanic/teichoic acid biosynthesis glycosyltransferase